MVAAERTRVSTRLALAIAMLMPVISILALFIASVVAPVDAEMNREPMPGVDAKDIGANRVGIIPVAASVIPRHSSSSVASADPRSTPVAEGLAPMGDNLVRIWNFDNSTKVWTVYDPAVLSLSDIEFLFDGTVYWFKIHAEQTVVLNDIARDLTCVNPGTPEEDCWNLIVW